MAIKQKAGETGVCPSEASWVTTRIWRRSWPTNDLRAATGGVVGQHQGSVATRECRVASAGSGSTGLYTRAKCSHVRQPLCENDGNRQSVGSRQLILMKTILDFAGVYSRTTQCL